MSRRRSARHQPGDGEGESGDESDNPVKLVLTATEIGEWAVTHAEGVPLEPGTRPKRTRVKKTYGDDYVDTPDGKNPKITLKLKEPTTPSLKIKLDSRRQSSRKRQLSEDESQSEEAESDEDFEQPPAKRARRANNNSNGGGSNKLTLKLNLGETQTPKNRGKGRPKKSRKDSDDEADYLTPKKGPGGAYRTGPFTVKMPNPLYGASSSKKAKSKSKKASKQSSKSKKEKNKKKKKKKKKVKTYHKELEGLLRKLASLDGDGIFQDPVQPEDAPGYFQVITRPMAFSDMKEAHSARTYASLDQLEEDFRTICTNAMTYNEEGSYIFVAAQNMLSAGNKLIKSTRESLMSKIGATMVVYEEDATATKGKSSAINTSFDSEGGDESGTVAPEVVLDASQYEEDVIDGDYVAGQDPGPTKCAFCKKLGPQQLEGEFLPMPFLYKTAARRIWVHENCALTAPEVQRSGDGTWYNVARAVQRSSRLKCRKCGEKGAAIGCYVGRCPRSYHLGCSGKDVAFYVDSGMYFCSEHDSPDNTYYQAAMENIHKQKRMEEKARKRAEAAKRKQAAREARESARASKKATPSNMSQRGGRRGSATSDTRGSASRPTHKQQQQQQQPSPWEAQNIPTGSSSILNQATARSLVFATQHVEKEKAKTHLERIFAENVHPPIPRPAPEFQRFVRPTLYYNNAPSFAPCADSGAATLDEEETALLFAPDPTAPTHATLSSAVTSLSDYICDAAAAGNNNRAAVAVERTRALSHTRLHPTPQQQLQPAPTTTASTTTAPASASVHPSAGVSRDAVAALRSLESLGVDVSFVAALEQPDSDVDVGRVYERKRALEENAALLYELQHHQLARTTHIPSPSEHFAATVLMKNLVDFGVDYAPKVLLKEGFGGAQA